MKLNIEYKKGPEAKLDVSVSPVKKVKTNYKALTCFVLVLAVLLAHLPILRAFESHIINVTARICHKSETGTIGFWRNHLEIAEPYFPIMLGDFEVINSNQAAIVFANANSKEMYLMLRAQLLAMKLNILHFGVGDYWVESHGMNLYDLTALADQLLIQGASREEMEDVMLALEGINDMHLLRVCLDKGMLPQVAVVEPNGGEEWEIAPEGYAVEGLGRYAIRWTAINPGGNDNDLLIYIWYCNDSGKNCFYPITGKDPTCDTQNDGECWWTIPNDQSFETKDPDARIKIIAIDKNNILRAGHDMSDENFCPKALSIEEIKARLGIVDPEPVMALSFDGAPEGESIIETSTESNNETFSGEEPVVEEVINEEVTTEDPTEEGEEEEIPVEEPVVEEPIVEEPVVEPEPEPELEPQPEADPPTAEEPVIESIIETSTESNNETYEPEE